MAQKLITTLIIFLFLIVAFAGLAALSAGNGHGPQVISQNSILLFIQANLASIVPRADLH
jgi:hypothetical protein